MIKGVLPGKVAEARLFCVKEGGQGAQRTGQLVGLQQVGRACFLTLRDAGEPVSVPLTSAINLQIKF